MLTGMRQWPQTWECSDRLTCWVRLWTRNRMKHTFAMPQPKRNGLKCTVCWIAKKTLRPPSFCKSIGEPEELKQEQRIPGMMGSKLQHRKCWVASWGEAPILKRKLNLHDPDLKKAFDDAKQGQETFVVRLSAPGNYQTCNWQNWNRLVKAPGSAARLWAQSILGNSYSLGYTFKFELIDEKNVRGMLRVHTRAAAESLIASSGHYNVETGQRWFCEAVSQNLQTHNIKLAWIPWHQPESWHEYADRCRRQDSQGLVHGRHQLALRVAEGDPRIVPRPSLWRAEIIPPGWSPQQLEQFCAQAGFFDIELIAKNWRRNGSSWLFKAMADNFEDTISVAVALEGNSEYEVTFTKEAKRRQHSAFQPLSRERSIKLNHHQQVNRPAPAIHLAEDAMDEEPVAHEDDSVDSAMGAFVATKRPAASTDTNSTKRKCWRGWLPDGAQRVDNQGGGDCLFLSIATALNSVMTNKSYSGSQVRLFLHSFMLQHHLEYEALWDRHKAGSGSPAQDDYTFQDYLSEIKIAGTWHGYLECYTAASALKRPVYLLDDSGEVTPFPYDGPKSQHSIALYYDGSGHFETLKGPQSMWDQLMLYSQKHQVQKRGFLGGGKCSPRPSCRLTDFAASSIAKNSLKRSKQCAQSKSGRSLALTDFATSQKQASSKSCRLTDFASPGQQSKSPRAKTPSMKLTQFASPVSTKKSATPWRQADGPAPWNKGKFVKHGKVSPAIVAPRVAGSVVTQAEL